MSNRIRVALLVVSLVGFAGCKTVQNWVARDIVKQNESLNAQIKRLSAEHDELKDELGQDPECYVCGCSSVAVPGRRLALSPTFRRSTYAPTPM